MCLGQTRTYIYIYMNIIHIHIYIYIHACEYIIAEIRLADYNIYVATLLLTGARE